MTPNSLLAPTATLVALTPALAQAQLAAAAPAAAAAPTDAAGALKPFRVAGFEKVILPDNMDMYVGKTVQLKTNQSEVVRVNLGYKFIAKLNGNIEAVVGGMPQAIPYGDTFTERKVSGGRISELPENALILCRQPVQHNFGQAMASAATLGLTQLAARYAADVQLCAVDADRDGKVEKLFLGGAKQQQDLDFTDIDPIPYDFRENYKVDDVTFVLYAMKTIWGSTTLNAAVQGNAGPTAVTRLWFENDGAMVDQKTTISVKKGNLPKEVRFGSSVFVIKKYDSDAGIIELEFTKYFDTQKIDWFIAPQITYIYY